MPNTTATPYKVNVKARIDEKAFPFDATGREKSSYRTRVGLAPLNHFHRSCSEKGIDTKHRTTKHSRTKSCSSFDRPQSAPAYSIQLGGTRSDLFEDSKRPTSRGEGEGVIRPKMRPNSAQFLNYPRQNQIAEDRAFGRNTRSRPKSAIPQAFVRPKPPTDNENILTPHERLFYRDYFSKLQVKRQEEQKYEIDEQYNRDSRSFDHRSKTIHAPPNETLSAYRFGRKKSIFKPRVMQHVKSGLPIGRGVSQKSNPSISRNASGGFYN